MKIKHRVWDIFTVVLFVFITIPTLLGQNADSLSLTQESQHFAFYSTNGDIKVLDSLSTILENNYGRITNRLEIQIKKKIKVKVYPDLGSFHIAINYPNAPDWVVGSCIGDELLMVSPLNPGSIHTYGSLMQVVIHEFVHIAVYYAIGDKVVTELPTWLNEGYAQYEAGQINDQIRKSVESSMFEKVPPTWSQLNNASAMDFGKINGYGLSVSIVEFLVVTYGTTKLVLLIKDPKNIEAIYGLPETTLENQWIHYVKHESLD